MTAAQKKDFAADCAAARIALAQQYDHPVPQRGITKLYLTQLACMDPHPNPSILIALAVVETSRKWSRKIGMPPLTMTDLLVGARVVGGDGAQP